jgi:hypothetical protein
MFRKRREECRPAARMEAPRAIIRGPRINMALTRRGMTWSPDLRAQGALDQGYGPQDLPYDRTVRVIVVLHWTHP